MLFKEYTYSVLIASSSAKFVTGIMPLLPENEFARERRKGSFWSGILTSCL